jgi:Na+/proline symporter
MQSVRLRYKIVIYVAAWLAALFATNPSGKYWPLAYMFPLGLAAFFSRFWANTGGRGVLIGCVAIYLVHALFYVRSRKWWSTLLLFGVLAILLICNVSGCRAMLNTH